MWKLPSGMGRMHHGFCHFRFTRQDSILPNRAYLNVKYEIAISH